MKTFTKVPALSLALAVTAIPSLAQAKSAFYARPDLKNAFIEIQDDGEGSAKLARTINWDGVSAIESPLSKVKTKKIEGDEKIGRFESNQGYLYLSARDENDVRVSESQNTVMGLKLTPVSESEVLAVKAEIARQNEILAEQINSRTNILGVYKFAMPESMFEQVRVAEFADRMIEIKTDADGALVAVVANWNGKVASKPKEVKVVGHQMMIEISSTEVIYLTPSAKGLILQEGDPKQIAHGVGKDEKTSYDLTAMDAPIGRMALTSEAMPVEAKAPNFIQRWLSK